MRSKKALLNILISLLLQVTVVFCGLIVPRLIIKSFGSSTNGLLSSITQFLGYIVFLEAGVGGVIRAALYKPLADNDIYSISKIMKASELFFKKVAYFFMLYLIIISVLFPYFTGSYFSGLFTTSLVLITGISIFSQYYFGISLQTLIFADQKQYVISGLQIFTLIVNTSLIVLLIKLGTSIHIVKLASTTIFVIRPILLNIYVNRKYKIIKNCIPDNDTIRQRWDGFGHHIAYMVLNSTDIAVITLFSNLKEVSVYSVYFMVISSVQTLAVTFSSNLEAAFGNIIANDEKESLRRNFQIFEFSSFTITTILFSSTVMLILPFISLYTAGVTDVNYNRPLFAYILIAALAVYCIRVPYHAVVLAAGHYKQTRNGALAEAIINIVLSVILVNYLGIVGVAIGTLCAMLFRTFQYALYLSKNILKRSIWEFIKRTIIYTIAAIIIITLFNIFPNSAISSYFDWFLYAIKVTVVTSTITFIVCISFYYKDFKNLLLIIKRLLSI